MSGSILVARELPPVAMEKLEAVPAVDVHRGETPLSTQDLHARLADKQALICQLTTRVDDALFAAAPNLKIVANVAVGYDNIDVEAATKRGILVTNTPGVLDDTTADFAWALLMAVARRVMDGERLVRSGQWKGWDLLQLLGSDVHGKTLGIVGFGNIGKRMAARARGFDMRVLYHNSRGAVDDANGAEYASLDDLLAQSDYVSLHCPLNDRTRHLIDADGLAKMKSTAYLINTARGPVVDEEALVAALRAGTIAGAGLDVFEREPEIHPELLELDGVVLAPHIASASIETRTKMAVMAVGNVLDALDGKRPPNLLNPAVLDG